MTERLTVAAFVLLAAAQAGADDSTLVTYVPDRAAERVPVNTVIPAYPKSARRERVEGDVQVCFHVDRRGRPYRIAVRESSDRAFERPAIRAVRASRYKPLASDATVPDIKTCRTFRFRLEPVTADNGIASGSAP